MIRDSLPKRLTLVLLGLMLGACQTFVGDDSPATLQAELTAYATEAAQIQQNRAVERTAIAATVEAAETRTAGFFQYNGLLLATARANQPADERVVVDVAGLSLADMYVATGQTRVVSMATTDALRAEDGCPQPPVNLFRPGVSVIYFAGLVVNAPQGYSIQTNWIYEGQSVYQATWQAPMSAERQCYSIALRGSNAPLLPGSWMVAISVGGERREPMSFTILTG